MRKFIFLILPFVILFNLFVPVAVHAGKDTGLNYKCEWGSRNKHCRKKKPVIAASVTPTPTRSVTPTNSPTPRPTFALIKEVKAEKTEAAPSATLSPTPIETQVAYEKPKGNWWPITIITGLFLFYILRKNKNKLFKLPLFKK